MNYNNEKNESYSCKKVEKSILSSLFSRRNDDNIKPYPYSGISYYTLNKLLKKYDYYLDSRNEVYNNAIKALFTGIMALLSTTLSISMLSNIQNLKEHIYQFIIFGALTPIITWSLSIKKIVDAIKENKRSLELFDELDEYRMDIPWELIEKKYDEKYSDKEIDEMIEVSPEPKFAKKLRNGYKKIWGE